MFGSSSSTGKIKSFIIGVSNANAMQAYELWACVLHTFMHEHMTNTSTTVDIMYVLVLVSFQRAQCVQHAKHMQINFTMKTN